MLGKRSHRAAVVALLTAFGALPVAAQSVDDVLARHYQAIGGVDGWVGLQTMKAAGTISINGGMMSGPFDIVQKRPAMARIEMTMQGMNIVQAYDGKTAWQIVPFTGSTEPVVADEATAKQIIEQADLDGPLIGWRESGHQVELGDATELDGQAVVELLVTLSNGTVSHYFFDADTYLPILIQSEIDGATTTTRFDDYRDIGGLTFPFSIEIDTPIGVQALTFSSVEVNPAVDESVFSMSGG